MTAAEAAQVLGIGRDAVIRELARSVNPLPHLKVGNTRYVRRAALEPHFAKLEVH
jgi:excisionase family DNA binding protein